MILPVIAIVVFFIGVAFGWLLWRSYFLAVAPALVIAIVLWIWLGWFTEPSEDLDRPLLLIYFGAWAVGFALCWAVGAALGLALNLRRPPDG
jgi:lipoprotein signal peptidase